MTTDQAGLDVHDDNRQTEGESLRLLDRSPHPYRLSSYRQTHVGAASDITNAGHSRKRRDVKSKKIASATGSSESGTEADDETERQTFVKALPPPQLKQRKGLKDGELDQVALLSPSQLDQDGRPLEGQGYSSKKESLTDKEERRVLFNRRVNEFARRCSEVGLMLVLSLLVLAGRGVWAVARQWLFELSCHIFILVGLILAYPVRLSLLDTRTAITKPWQRFRVPVSFDPATVLYPPVLPVLVALSVSPLNAALILPNLLLGLSALPQRLFLRSSRLGGLNTLHWLVSILPLALGPRTKWLQSISSSSNLNLSVETLVSLYPLHHSLMATLHYLTTTSLLISELHLLSIALINLLLFASAPQAVILKACLWLGGFALFAMTERVLQWNIILARVPKWKLRHPGHPDAERRSLIDAVAGIMNLQRATKAFQGLSARRDSDADEDHDDAVSLRHQRSDGTARDHSSVETFRAVNSQQSRAQALLDKEHSAVASADEFAINSKLPETIRRLTLPASSIRPELVVLNSKKRAKKRTSHITWCLRLTVKQSYLRKTLYAAWTYAALVSIILGPVRYYIGQKALHGREPIGWALMYLFGQIGPLRALADMAGFTVWLALPTPPGAITDLLGVQIPPMDIVSTREIIGSANMRLVLIAYWLVVLSTGLLAVFTLTPYVEVDTRRKIFHGVMVGMFMPAMFIDPCFCALAVSLVLAIFLILEVIRAAQVPPLGTAIGRFIAPYVDGRDLRGPVVVSHLFLLIGCAVPLWFSLAGTSRQDDGVVWKGWETLHATRDVGMLSGVICVGMGDAAASLIGRRYGRRKWPWVGGKSFEGSAAFALAVTVGLLASKIWLSVGGWHDVAALGHRPMEWLLWLLKAVICACGASFMEAVLTGANDNVVVPVALWLFVKGMRL